MPRDVPAEMAIASVRSLLGSDYSKTMEQAFPDLTPPVYPVGNRIIVQLMTPAAKSLGGILLPDESKDAAKYRTQTALVRALGPVAFHNRSTLASWPEGAWCKPGWFVRVPMYGGDRLAIPTPDNREALFLIINDVDVIGVITESDPLSIKTLF